MTFFTALKLEDLSIASPLRQTIPLFVAFLEPLFLSTVYSLSIISGALLTVAGSYVVMFEGDNYIKPLLKLKEKGAILAVASAFFLASGSISVKFVVNNIPVLLFLSIVFWVSAAILGLFTYTTRDIQMLEYRNPGLLYLAIVSAIGQGLIFLTIQLSTASKATILFRLSILFNILIGFNVLNEKNLYYRLLGGILIIAGIYFVI
ncbi:MAG: DMT family transporter [Candidatus Nanohaloarchaea archaeon]